MSNRQQIPHGRKRTNSRERIIDAAIDLCCMEGVRHLSLDAVAERAGLSKGGLLYNFSSKSALLQAMVTRHVETLGAAVAQSSIKTACDGQPNARIRAYVMAVRDLLAGKGSAPAGFLAAIAEEPQLLDPVRLHNEQLVRDITDESESPDLAVFAFLTVEGIRSMRLFDLSPFDDPTLLGYLDKMIDLLGRAETPPIIAATPGHPPPQGSVG
ncbi:TetR family transcriptional regulator [Breoghania corrubedonensis]|uniref:TetR family transcriptional regulator n=1 Tax=Breoghania corrubedonensis TaxID=665038 RepID=A0A2T5VI00_9HYPH|nr:TetR/AcrR family transcriptional regulator [Breoghania corrubedonensis]PTW63385.1 TetR family transcriptional regulator [Breoghania corrubedonensis]